MYRCGYTVFPLVASSLDGCFYRAKLGGVYIETGETPGNKCTTIIHSELANMETKVQIKSTLSLPYSIFSPLCSCVLLSSELRSVFQPLAYRQQYIQGVCVKLRPWWNWLPESVWSSEPRSPSPAGHPELWGKGWRSCLGPVPFATATAPSGWPCRAESPPG